MVFGGVQKNSFIDYPGRMSCVLFVTGCNFDCPYCHNPGLVKGGSACPNCLSEEDACCFLEKRKGFLDGVVISGGEPTLRKDLAHVCEKIKKIGFPVKLDTNGSRPKAVKRLIDDGLVDYIAMDIKGDPLAYSPLIAKEEEARGIIDSIRIIMESAPAYEFRTTCVRPIVDEDIIENIARLIRGAPLYALQRFNNTEVLNPSFFLKTGAVYGEEELVRMKALAEPWVKECILR